MPILRANITIFAPKLYMWLGARLPSGAFFKFVGVIMRNSVTAVDEAHAEVLLQQGTASKFDVRWRRTPI
jgi:hypothetical protein